jgi:hypothetical protein
MKMRRLITAAACAAAVITGIAACGGGGLQSYSQVVAKYPPNAARCNVQASMDGTTATPPTLPASQGGITETMTGTATMDGTIVTGRDGYRYRIISGDVPSETTLQQLQSGNLNGAVIDLPCLGMKVIVTKHSTIHGKIYQQGTKLTVDAHDNFTPISGW